MSSLIGHAYDFAIIRSEGNDNLVLEKIMRYDVINIY